MKKFICYEYGELSIGAKCVDSEQNFEDTDFTILEEAESRFSSVYKVQNKKLKFRNYVGVICLGGLHLEILPKVFKDHVTTEPATGNRKLLFELLSEAGYFDHKYIHDAAAQEHESIEKFIAELYCLELTKVLNAGLMKQYRSEEKNTSALKGKLLVSKNLAYNLLHPERFYTSQVNYVHDHPLNRVLLAALEAINSRGLRTEHNVEALKARFSSSIPRKQLITKRDLKLLGLMFRGNRKLRRFRGVYKLARLILLRLSINPVLDDTDGYSMLFNMNKLFERWLRRRLQLQGFVQEKRIYDFVLSSDLSGPKNNLTATLDTLLDLGGTGKIVIDAKWKLLNIDDPKANITDIRQVYTYGQLIEGVKHIALVSPYHNSVKPGVVAIQSYTAKHRSPEHVLTLWLAKINLAGDTGDRDTAIDQFIGAVKEHGLQLSAVGNEPSE